MERVMRIMLCAGLKKRKTKLRCTGTPSMTPTEALMYVCTYLVYCSVPHHLTQTHQRVALVSNNTGIGSH